jgi:hypothetical protein
MPRMRATRRTQPYRKSAAGRQGGRTLAAMLKGRTGTGKLSKALAEQYRRRQRAARGKRRKMA